MLKTPSNQTIRASEQEHQQPQDSQGQEDRVEAGSGALSGRAEGSE